MANQVAEKLFETEVAIDGALTKLAGLAGLLPRARMESNISAVVGQSAFESIARSLTALTEARREIVDTHHRLVEMQNAVGLRGLAFGGGEKPEGESPRPPGVAVLETRRTG